MSPKAARNLYSGEICMENSSVHQAETYEGHFGSLKGAEEKLEAYPSPPKVDRYEMKIEKNKMLMMQGGTTQESIASCISKQIQDAPELPNGMFRYVLSTRRILREVSKSYSCRNGKSSMSLVLKKQEPGNHPVLPPKEKLEEDGGSLNAWKVNTTIRAFLGIHGLVEGTDYTVSSGCHTTHFHLSVPKEKKHELEFINYAEKPSWP